MSTVSPVAPMRPALTNTHPALRRGWHAVARSGDIGARATRVRLLGDEWDIARGPAGIDRAIEARLVTEPRQPVVAPFAVAERHGMVFLAPEEPVADLLDVPELDDSSFLVGHLAPSSARVGAGLMVDNFLDVAHFPFVHAPTIGTGDGQEVGEVEITRQGFAMEVRSVQRFPNHEDPGVAAGERPLLQHRRVAYAYRAPFLLCLRIDYVEAGGSNVIAFFVQPEDDDRCTLWTTVARDDLAGDRARMAHAMEFEQSILDEDLRLQERYPHRSLPLDLTTEVHVRADRPTVELRRILAALVAAS